MRTTSETVKHAGLKSLEQMSAISGRATSTLKDWHKSDRQGFDVMLVGCVALVAKPFGLWLKPETLIGTGYEGRVVYKTMKGVDFAGFIQGGRVWNGATVEKAGDVAAVMAYEVGA